ncbi:MAG TPA: hypothetical protein VGX03_31065 [Candidatus Binatia bacterium]|nr:hypothetical protein [Candidatus Binatia bacterium]
MWNKVQSSAKFYSELEKEVFELVKHFKGQKVPGHLFNAEGEFTLPTFTDVLPNHRIASEGMLCEVDILGEGQGFRWVIEIKGVLRDGQSGIAQVRALSHALKAQPWLIVFTDLSASTRAAAHAHGVLITGANEWKELKKLILAESHNA